MADKDKIQKVTEPDDPQRCQGVNAHGQCMNVSLPDAEMCIVHGGNKQQESADKKKLDLYRMHKFEARMAEVKHSSAAKSLFEEVAILRVMLEERFSTITDNTDLILQSGPISDLVMKIEKVVTSANKLNASMGNHLDKSQIIHFASQVVEIVASEVKDPETVKRISNRLLSTIAENDEEE